MRKIYSIIVLIGLVFTVGCVPLVLVGGGAVVGYSLSGDAATGNVTASYRSIWDRAVEVLNSYDGSVSFSNESKGIIKARISDYSITVKIDTITSETQKLRVSARKYLMPKPQFAQKIFVKISENLE